MNNEITRNFIIFCNFRPLESFSNELLYTKGSASLQIRLVILLHDIHIFL